MIQQARNSKKIRGFTLLEIVVVIIIVGILATLALPRMMGTVERMRTAEGVQLLTALLSAQRAFELETGDYTNDLDDLDVEIDSARNFDIPPDVDDPADPVADPVATITRTGGYTLGINEEGSFCCTDGGTISCAYAGISYAYGPCP